MQKNTINLIIFNLVNTGAQFLLVMILSRYLSKNEYATFRQLFLPFEIVSPLLGLGLSSTIFYFYPRFLNKRKLLLSVLSLVFTTCFVFEMLLTLGLDKLISIFFNNDSILEFFYYLGFFSFFSLSNTILYSYFILENKVKVNIIVNFIFNSLLIATVFFIVIYENNLEYVILLRTSIYGMIFFVMILKVDLFNKLSFSVREFITNTKLIFIYSLPISFSLIMGVFSCQLDKIIVSSFCTTKEYAIYINGAFEVPVIAIITSSLAGASFGLFTEFCNEKKYLLANNLFKRVSLASAIIIFPSFVFLFYFSKEVIVLMFSEKYLESYFIFRIYLLLLPIRIIQYGNVLIALGKTNVLLIRSIVELLISLILSLIFFQLFGYRGIVFGPVIAVLLWTVPYNLLIISRGFELRLNSILPIKKLSIVFLACCISIIVVFIIDFSINNLKIIYKMIINFTLFSFIYLCMINWFKIITLDLASKQKIIIH
jgi:O-antigen/teichoic acid export membrane protein